MNERGAAAKGRADILALGFGVTVTMWVLGYLSRLPGTSVPSWLLGGVLLACLLGGGLAAGRWTAGGWRTGAAVGLLVSVLNLLVLGSLLGGEHANELAPSAVWWLPGSLLAGAALGAAGAWLGERGVHGTPIATDWTAVFTRVAVAATFCLLMIGGLVTSSKAGLAVVDWPNSFGYNMFLYPLSRMTGGIYFEHAHRLFGSLVGITTAVLAAHLFRVEPRRRVKLLATVAVALVIAQGVLGGLRVTGHLTLATSPDAVAPNVTLAVAHGVLGQLFFALLVAIAVFASPSWKATASTPLPRASVDSQVAASLVGVLIVQLVLGAVQRHLARGLLVHVGLAVVVVALGSWTGVRALALRERARVLARAGRVLVVLLFCQVGLGLTAFAAVGFRSPDAVPEPWQVVVATAHQATGAALLATAVVLALWTRRHAAAG